RILHPGPRKGDHLTEEVEPIIPVPQGSKSNRQAAHRPCGSCYTTRIIRWQDDTGVGVFAMGLARSIRRHDLSVAWSSAGSRANARGRSGTHPGRGTERQGESAYSGIGWMVA